MGKIICDVCGTAYPDNAEQCPICGSARPADQAAPDGSAPEAEDAGYRPVKGGRFSKGNVRRRAKAAAAPVPVPRRERRNEPPEPEDEEDEDEGGSNRGLIIAVIVLLLAILAVGIYIFMRFFAPNLIQPNNTEGTTVSPMETTGSLTPAVPCTGLTVTQASIRLDKVGRAELLEIAVTPADTTEELSYSSSDKSVAAVTAEGRVVAIGPGEAVITVKCGSFSQDIPVVCDFSGTPEPSTEPSTEPEPTDPQPTEPKPTEPKPTEPKPTEPKPTEPKPTEPPSDFTLNRKDFTLFSPGSSHKLYNGKIDIKDVEFSSDDESIATFIGGKVVAVGPGKTIVRAKYDGEELTCIVRCKWTPAPTEPTEPSESSEPPEPSESSEPPKPSESSEPTESKETYSVQINGKDMGGSEDLAMGDEFTIQLVGSSGTIANVTWTSSDNSVCGVSGNKLVLKAEGKATLSTTFEGKTYSFKVTVVGEAVG